MMSNLPLALGAGILFATFLSRCKTAFAKQTHQSLTVSDGVAYAYSLIQHFRPPGQGWKNHDFFRKNRKHRFNRLNPLNQRLNQFRVYEMEDLCMYSRVYGVSEFKYAILIFKVVNGVAMATKFGKISQNCTYFSSMQKLRYFSHE